MSKLSRHPSAGGPLLDIASYARRGTGRRDRLSAEEIAHISRTVRRAPEVVVKVLTKGSNDIKSVAKHVGYIGRLGELAIETDDGEQLKGRGVGMRLAEDWDLDLDDTRSGGKASRGRKPKLVHKLMLSMPAGTPPNGLLAAARNFLREEFALKHRYVFALHTDEPHPHVHVVVKAVSEQGLRLHIRKATLREWRREFARHLREQGISANATDRSVRGQTKGHKLDGIYRAMKYPQRGSTHMRGRANDVAAQLASGGLRVGAGKSKLLETRSKVERGWQAIAEVLAQHGQATLSSDVQRFLHEMPPVRTENEQIAVEIKERAKIVKIREMNAR